MQGSANKKSLYGFSQNHTLRDTDLKVKPKKRKETQGLIKAKATRLSKLSGKNYD